MSKKTKPRAKYELVKLGPKGFEASECALVMADTAIGCRVTSPSGDELNVKWCSKRRAFEVWADAQMNIAPAVANLVYVKVRQ